MVVLRPLFLIPLQIRVGGKPPFSFSADADGKVAARVETAIAESCDVGVKFRSFPQFTVDLRILEPFYIFKHIPKC